MLNRKNSNTVFHLLVPYEDCPAKTFVAPDELIYVGRSTLNHCQIVGSVAKALISRFPNDLRNAMFPVGAELVAACHDIGKVSPCFYEKIRQACSDSTHSLVPLNNINPALEMSWGGHAGVSQVTARELGAPQYIPEILGQHHGFSPEVQGKRANDENFGGPLWQAQRKALFEQLKSLFAVDWPKVDSIPQARLLAGLTSVSDWIGSGQFFENPNLPWEDNVNRALDDAGYIAPIFKNNLSFEQAFGFVPRSAQQQFIEEINSPGVYILEAPMGMGKTEAALYAAYKMLQSGQSNGIYFALPTQLTSNKIYERFNNYLSAILSDECNHRSLLLHGNAWLIKTELGEEGRPGGAWFNHSKRGLLAPFAVGTIDQALMAAMNVKHGFVRAFGLAGKVVILDEVHTYDAYTGTILDALIDLLRGLQCTVIILSATLSHDRREKMLGSRLTKNGYPLITVSPNAKETKELAVIQDVGNSVVIQWETSDLNAVDQALLRASEGQQVLWIENTVHDAQQRYLDLAARASDIGIDCGLLHSRFTIADRAKIENRWVNIFGKSGWAERNKQGRILVGTQVLEQSLDIDADFMVSRFAPTDMILQRLGRLWRNELAPRNSNAKCEVCLLAPLLDHAIANPTEAFGASAFVYSPYVLCRSLEVWHERQIINLPADIRSLIENTYADRDEQGFMSKWLHDLDNGTRLQTGRKAMQQLAKITLSDAGNTLPESKAQTRFSETDTHEVLLIKQVTRIPKRKVTLITLLNGEKLELPWFKHGNKSFWRRLSSTLMQQIVLVRVHDAPKPLPLVLLEKLRFQHCFYLGQKELDEALLRVVLVDETSSLHGLDGTSVHDKKNLLYRNDLGYQITKKQEYPNG
jgi:CRISPR-associated endonuclease/helicase Cas3